MLKRHLVDYKDNGKTPKKYVDIVAVCGYQRRFITSEKELVKCKLCLRAMNK